MNRIKDHIKNPDAFTAIVTVIPHDEYGFATGVSEKTRYHAVRSRRGRKLVHVAERTPNGYYLTFCGGWGNILIEKEVDEPVTCRKCRKRAIDLGIAVGVSE